MSLYNKMYPTQKQTSVNSDEIKMRFVFNVPYKYKEYAKECKLCWNSNCKYWYYDLIFSNINDFQDLINDEEKEFNFPSNKIYDFKIIRFDDNNNFEDDEYEMLFKKYAKIQNIYINK